MSVVCIMTPVVIASWPAISSAVTAAAVSLGYTVVEETARTASQFNAARSASSQVNLEIPKSEVVADSMGRDQRISVTRDGVTVTFSRDARGKAALCVTGAGPDEAELRARGEELSQKVVQQYVYQRLTDELRARQFMVVEEATDQNQAIRIKVRHWEN